MEKREIKFRMWSGTKMLYDVENVYNCMAQQAVHDKSQPTGGRTPPYDHHKDGSVFLQYTGLEDKNGKEIYGGDHNGWAVVVFENGGFWLDVVGSNESFPLWEQAGAIDIVGNIHEHPHLLKQ